MKIARANYQSQLVNPYPASRKTSAAAGKIGLKIIGAIKFTAQAPRNWKVTLISCSIFSTILCGSFILLAPFSLPAAIFVPPVLAHVAHRVTIIALNRFFDKLPDDKPQYQRPFMVGVTGSVAMLAVGVGMNMLLSPIITPFAAFPIAQISGTVARIAAAKAASIVYTTLFGPIRVSRTLEEIGDLGYYWSISCTKKAIKAIAANRTKGESSPPQKDRRTCRSLPELYLHSTGLLSK